MSGEIDTDAIRALTWDKITAVVVTDLLNEVDDLRSRRAERDRLASLVEKLRPYIHHESGYPAVGCHEACVSRDAHACNCDLADLLTEMETPHEEGEQP